MLSKYISKPTSVVVRPHTLSEQKPKKKRSVRSHGGFLYRGIAFSYANRGDLVVLSTWNEKTNMPNPGIIVDKNKKRRAIGALARIVLAERELEEMGAISPEAGVGNA